MSQLFTIYDKNPISCYSFNILHFVHIENIPFRLVKINKKNKEENCLKINGVFEIDLICIENSNEDWILFYSKIKNIGGVVSTINIPFVTKKGFKKFRNSFMSVKSI